MIFDAYRPWYVTWMFWEGTPPRIFGNSWPIRLPDPGITVGQQLI